jgi:hypothetical protein
MAGVCLKNLTTGKKHVFGIKCVSDGLVVGCTFGVRFQSKAIDSSLIHNVHIDSGVLPVYCKRSAEGSFPGVQQQGREADHPTPYSVEVENGGTTLPLPHHHFMA